MTDVWRGGLFFALAVIAAGVVVLAVARKAGVIHGKPERTACIQLVAGPTRLYACDNGRAYSGHGSHVRDIGPLTPLPVVPKS